MGETLTLLAELAESKGISTVLWIVALVIILFNVDKIGAAFERLLVRFIPSYELRAKHRQEDRQHRLEIEQRERDSQEQERVDTILVFKDLLLEYRKRLDDNELALRQARNELLEIVAKYERRDAQVIEALRDISEALRAQTERIDRLTAQMEKDK